MLCSTLDSCYWSDLYRIVHLLRIYLLLTKLTSRKSVLNFLCLTLPLLFSIMQSKCRAAGVTLLQNIICLLILGSILCGQRWTQLSIIPEISWHGPWRPLQHCQLRTFDPHDRACDRTETGRFCSHPRRRSCLPESCWAIKGNNHATFPMYSVVQKDRDSQIWLYVFTVEGKLDAKFPYLK